MAFVCCWSVYESGNQQILHNIKKGLLIPVAKRFAKDCHDLGIVVHGTFILGLPGETRETIQETLKFAKEVNPHTIQVSLAGALIRGTFLYKQRPRKRLVRQRHLDGVRVPFLGKLQGFLNGFAVSPGRPE